MSASFPTSVWSGASDDRPTPSVTRKPSGKDWLRMVKEIQAVQRVLDGIGVSTAGAFGAADPSKTNQLYKAGAGTNEVQSLAQIASVSGTWSLSITLPGNTAVVATPLAFDINAAELETAIDTACAGLVVNGVTFTAGDISVSGASDINAGALTLTFDGASVDKLNIAQVTTADIDLSDSTPPVASTSTPGVSANNLTLSGAGAATYPNVWDGTTSSRTDPDADRAPDYADWYELIQQVAALEARVLALDLNEDGTLKASSTGLIQNGVLVSVVGAASVTPWDGVSDSRPDPDVRRGPDNLDYEEAFRRLHNMMRMLVPLGFDADGALETSDPSVAGQWWNNSGTVNVSAG